MTNPQGSHFATDSVASRAIALVDIGYSPGWVGPRIGVSGRTVQRWCARSRELTRGNKAVLDKWTKRTLQAQDLIGDGLDVIEEDDTRQLALKNLQTLNIIAGTGTDKLQKEHEPPALHAQNVLVVVNAAKPVIVEGTPDIEEGEVVSRE